MSRTMIAAKQNNKINPHTPMYRSQNLFSRANWSRYDVTISAHLPQNKPHSGAGLPHKRQNSGRYRTINGSAMPPIYRRE